MTLSEFKAWFEGYTENIDNAPNQKQWKRIKGDCVLDSPFHVRVGGAMNGAWIASSHSSRKTGP